MLAGFIAGGLLPNIFNIHFAEHLLSNSTCTRVVLCRPASAQAFSTCEYRMQTQFRYINELLTNDKHLDQLLAHLLIRNSFPCISSKPARNTLNELWFHSLSDPLIIRILDSGSGLHMQHGVYVSQNGCLCINELVYFSQRGIRLFFLAVMIMVVGW